VKSSGGFLLPICNDVHGFVWRFHVLAEFDEAKRSCRRRLAGHNKRRRKPQPDPLQFTFEGKHSILIISPYGFDLQCFCACRV
jgi:hypothetical protein